MERGVLVDFNGYFLAAYEWDIDETPKDTLNYIRKFAKQKRRSDPEGTRYILTDDAATAAPLTNGRWDFAKREWLLPTEEYQLLKQRRDAPRFWAHSSSRKVWPDNLPRIPAGARWEKTAPPAGGRSRRWLWDSETGEYVLPVQRLVTDKSGEIVNCVSLLPTDDVEGLTPDAVEVEDETGQKRGLVIGDKMTPKGKKLREACVPAYRAIPVRLLERALSEVNLSGAFAAFINSKGYTIEQVRELGTISLQNKVLREFVTDQGFTMKQAYNALQKKAEEFRKDEAKAIQELSVNVADARN